MRATKNLFMMFYNISEIFWAAKNIYLYVINLTKIKKKCGKKKIDFINYVLSDLVGI